MKVLVVSEGKHELSPESDSSPLVELTRRLMNQNADFVREKVSSRKVRIHCPHGKSAAYEKRALGWIRYAQKEGYNALVFVIDQDGQKKRKTGIENAQIHTHFVIPRAMAVAIQSFDAWMLADEGALSEVLGGNVQRQKDPELIKEPKIECEKINNESPRNLSLTEFYFQVAKVIDLDRLRERCPDGFGPFRVRVENMFTN
ncbi:MAG: hypothetical protein IH899_18925 [Planctomycetes bacterium]|nr:hypothetical protein [Planctomycetota bacterium]